VRGRSDTGELSLPAWKTPGRGRRASEVHHAVSDSGRGQTSNVGDDTRSSVQQTL